MALPRTQRLVRGPHADGEGLSLSPEEYFVLSRVDGSLTVAQLLASSGLPSSDTERIVDKLLEVGALELSADGPEERRPSRPRPSGKVLRAQVEARRRRMLDARLEVSPPAEDAPPPAREAEPAELERCDAPQVQADDPRLDPALALPVDDQRWILALYDGAETLGHFEVLGIVPTHDLRVIRRAFHEVSRRLHPDAYYGRDLGSYTERLAAAFVRAKQAHDELQEEEVRAPYVHRLLQQRARHAEVAEQKAAAQRALEDLRLREEEEAAAERRRQRAAVRAERQRERVRARVRQQGDVHLREAQAAEEAGKLAQAANLYRLAMQARPDDPGLREHWNRTRAEARRGRAADAFQKATSYLDIGQSNEARALFVEAAEADPTAEHLAYAADAIRHDDPVRARDFAMAALDALVASSDKQRKKSVLVNLHCMIGRAFLAAGQKASAKQQAQAALELRPNDPQVRALLNSIKVT